ncbi:hypothetical protein AAF712_005002 [Marasmius tenuissimus]|uniref:Uncharacterized protein n=1 Tax=Marasmius tenuissimus TaxID=585030 RepID=A0ABR3A393_9AGAR
MAPTVAGDYDEPDEDQPGPSKRARPLHNNAAVRYASPVSTCFYDATSSPSASPRKGKQKALEEEPEEERFSDVDEDVLAMPPPPVPISRKGKERAGKDAIIDDWMRGKERELQEEQRRWERDRDKVGDEERERDKQRIQLLEEEVKRLRDELFKRSTSTSFTASNSSTSSLTLPPPPPPPPPPPGVLIRAPTTPAPNPEVLFASTRASLKHAGTPNEAPINRAYGLGTSVNSGRRAGKPTVGLQPDKIADFLKEMKSVKLRKVGVPGLGDHSLSTSLRRGDGDGGEFSFSFSSSSRRDSGTGNSSWQSDMDHILAGSSSRLREKEKEPLSEVSVGKKRKREEDPKTSHRPTKEIIKPPSRVHNSSFASTVSVASSSSSLPSRPSSFTRNQPSHPPSKSSPPTTSETAMPPPPLSRRSRSTTRSNSASSPPVQAPPRSKSPSTSIRRTSTSSAPSEHEASTSSYRLYTLPPGTNGPSRAWAPSAVLSAPPPPPPNETPSLCSDVPEGSTSVEDDELEDGYDGYERAAPAPHVVVSPERSPGVGIGRRRRDIEDVDVDMEGAIDEDDDMGGRRNEKRPRLSRSPHQPYNMGESSNSSTSPVQEHPPPSTVLPPRFSTPMSSDPPVQEKSGKPQSLAATAAFSRRVPVSPMPVTPSPQRPRPPASRGRERERERPRIISGETEPATDVVVALRDGSESVPRSRARSKSKSRSRPPTPHVRRTQPTRDEEEDEDEEQREKSSSRETDDVDAVKQEDEEVSSEDPLSLGQNTSAESLSQSQSEVRYRLDLSHSSVRSMPSRIPVARSTSLKRNKLGGSTRELARSAAGTSGSSTSHARPQAQDKPTASASTPDDIGSSRRRTLDQELKDIVARRSDEPDHYYEESGPQPPSAREMRRSTLTAVGTRNRRKGYLAHGGAGGVPVYMGNGYVAGPTRQDEDDGEADREQQEYDEDGVEAEGEEDIQDEDDLEYLPSPPKNQRRAKARSTNRR